MKTKILLLLAIPFLALTSCDNVTSFDTKDIDVFNLDLKKDNNQIDSCKDGQVKVRFAKNKELIPYLSLNQYAKLYESHLDPSMISLVQKTGSSESWVVYKQENFQKMTYFMSEVDYSRKTISVAGSLQNALKADDNPRDLKVLSYGIETTGTNAQLGKSYFAEYSFKNNDISLLNEKNNYYLPLGLLDITYSFGSGLYFYYNYNAIYSTSDASAYFDKTIYAQDNKEVVVNSEAKDKVAGQTIPSYLVEYNANLFFYLMDNFYGLKDYKGISSAKSFYKVQSFYKNMFSTDGPTRAQAYADAMTILDDNHSGLVKASEAWNESGFTRYAATGCYNRSRLNLALNLQRAQTLDSSYADRAVIYSDDGKTAMFYFNEFSFATSEEVFNSDGSIKEDAGKYDTFFGIIDCFKQIKNKGGVQNVIFDMCTNGGGTLGVLMKILALISKDNQGCLSYLEADSMILSTSTSRVDINGDGLYDKNDCFGDDFNIYLLTSDCSFSCGNALPCCAQIAKSAKIIGQTSGGGECVVGIHYLPNGEYVYHSSNIHIGSYDEATGLFTGFENGATPDIEIDDYTKFFDINYLNSLILAN